MVRRQKEKIKSNKTLIAALEIKSLIGNRRIN